MIRVIRHPLFILIAGLTAIFTLSVVYYSCFHKKVNYQLFLYGADISTSRHVLAQVYSPDGIVPSPRFSIDNIPVPGPLLPISDTMTGITIQVGSEIHTYPVSYSQLVKAGEEKKETVSFTTDEIEHANRAVQMRYIGDKEIFLLPASFRMPAEFPAQVYIFCFTEDSPCSEKNILVDGKEVPLTEGVALATLFMAPDRMLKVSVDGISGSLLFPFPGKMFFMQQEQSKITLYSLAPLDRTSVDCYKNTTWLFTTFTPTNSSGSPLSQEFTGCDRIQASYLSSDPGTSFAVQTSGKQEKALVRDPYYSLLREKLDLIPDWKKKFDMIYARSFFITLPVIYTPDHYKIIFEKNLRQTRNILWWSMAAIAIIIISGFWILMRARLVEVRSEDEDNELITLSRTHQQLLLLGAVILLVLLFGSYLWVLRGVG